MPAQLVASDRVRLAALTRDVALAVPGVRALDAGPARRFFTAGAGEIVSGVNCVAAPEGGFDLSLQLVCDLVPLRPVAERVRAAVETAAAGAEMIARSVTIRVTDVVEPAAAA